MNVAPLLSAALLVFLAGGLWDLFGPRRVQFFRVVPYLAALAGSVCLCIVGVVATLTRGHPPRVDVPIGFGEHLLHLDQLAGLFLTLCFGLGAGVSACLISWSRLTTSDTRRGVGSGVLLLLASVAVILVARDAFVFLFAWELLSLSFYVLTSVTRTSPRQVGASWSTLGMGKFGGAALLIAFLLLAGRAHSLDFAAWHGLAPGGLFDVAWVLIVVGFAAKVGLAPFQVWIPIGYPAASGPARAAMAGIAANVGVYGLWRFLGVLGNPPLWLTIAVLVAGGITALLGITFAGVQSGLARLIAYSSVENAGLIVAAYGIAMTGVVVHISQLVAVGLLAATLQTVAHAIGKSTLFVSLARFESTYGTDDLDRLRGVGRAMPWSGVAFGAGALTLAGLPVTIGFISEWFILEAFMQQFRLSGLSLRLGLAIAAALVALTAGLGALVFIRVLALTILGKGPATRTLPARERGLFAKAALALLAIACLGLAALSPWEFRFLADGLQPVVGRSVTLGALKSPWVLQPVFPGFSILSPSWLWVVMPIAVSVVFLVAVALSRGRFLRLRRVPAWHSATSGVDGPSDYTAFGFANPLRHVLANVLGTQRTVTSQTSEEGSSSQLETTTVVIEPFEAYLYRPLRSAVLALSRVARRMQSGLLNAYVAYMLLALLAALAITAALR